MAPVSDVWAGLAEESFVVFEPREDFAEEGLELGELPHCDLGRFFDFVFRLGRFGADGSSIVSSMVALGGAAAWLSLSVP